MTTTHATHTSDTKTASNTKTASTKQQDAIHLLKSDHRKVEELFDEFEHSRNENKKEKIVKSICDELTIHAEIEENIFYPVVQDAFPTGDRNLVLEARVEHATLKWLIAQLQQEDSHSELYDAKVTVLKEYVTHHVHEEEKEMFPKITKTSIDLKGLAALMLALKEKLKNKLIS